MKDKLYQVYCIIGNRIWDYLDEHDITVRRGHLIVRTSSSIVSSKLEQIINDFGLKL